MLKRLVPQKEGDPIKIKVSFEHDSNTFDREISINSKDIARIGDNKSSEDTKFREELKAGDKIDCYDSTKFWYASTVLKVETKQHKGETLRMAYVAFRVAHEKGD